ncbi:MAG: substrate-binding domain-containing protein [Clostridia bacterium]|nr:substrate-binding domain-containing protein [Clostridia bacterium]
MKKFLALALVVAMALSCVSAVAEGNALVSWYTFGDVYLSSVREALDAAFAAKGIAVTDKDSNGVQQTQTDDVNTAVTTGTNALVINLVDSNATQTAANLLQVGIDNDLPVVFFNRAVGDQDAAGALLTTYDKTVFVGTNFDEAGKMQGTMVGQYVIDHYDEIDLNGDGVITYVMFKGDMANQEAIYRTMYGVQYANIELEKAGKPALQYYDASAPTNGEEGPYLCDMNGTWSQTASNEYMTTILAQYNESNGNMVELVIANNDDMAIGAIRALEVAGYNVEGAHTIPVFGVDATDAAKAEIAAGKMTGSIKQDAVGMADAVATITANLMEGKDKFDGMNEAYSVTDGWFVAIPYSVYTGE